MLNSGKPSANSSGDPLKMSMVCSLNSDGSQANNSNPNTNTNTNTNTNANTNATANTNTAGFDFAQQQQQQHQQSLVEAPNASTPLLLGHESAEAGHSGTASSTVLPPVLQLEAPSVSLSASTAAAAAPSAAASGSVAVATGGGDAMLSLPNGSLGLPGGLNFVVGAGATGVQANSNDNNNNMDNASDDSNPVTIYR